MNNNEIIFDFSPMQVNAAFHDIICEGACEEDWMLMHKKGNSIFFKNKITRSYWELEIKEYMQSNNFFN
jgi:hypothetical protein